MINEIRKRLAEKPGRSAWKRGVTEYAYELLETMEDYYNRNDDFEFYTDTRHVRDICLNGADNWDHYSWSGCSLCYNGQIAERLCCPSDLKRCNYGAWRPNRNEYWLDVQARALFQAFNRIMHIIRDIQHEAEVTA